MKGLSKGYVSSDRRKIIRKDDYLQQEYQVNRKKDQVANPIAIGRQTENGRNFILRDEKKTAFDSHAVAN